jgi:hypothetical protein
MNFERAKKFVVLRRPWIAFGPIERIELLVGATILACE